MPRKPTKRKKRNPEPEPIEQAAQLSERFHGRPAKEIKMVPETEASHPAVAELGKLVLLRVRTAAGERFDLDCRGRGVLLCATPDGRNLVFVAGDQELKLPSLGIESDKDQTRVGELTHIIYDTRKGFHNFERTDYVHEFGEDDRAGGDRPRRPDLGYSRLNRHLYIEGGAYQVRPEGIVN